MKISIKIFTLLLLGSISINTSWAQDINQEDRRTIRAVPAPDDFVADGHLNENIYTEITPATNFIQQEPNEGDPATEQTDVWILFDDRNVYVSARMWDSQPDRIIANEMRRDAGMDIYQNANFSVTLDTFNDHRTGFYFMTNPLGVLRDAQIINEDQSNAEWDPIWNPQAQRFEQGWTVEMEIPFKSIRYPTVGEQVWGVLLRRVVRWKNEIAFFTPMPASVGPTAVYRMENTARLVGIITPESGMALEIKPYGISRLSTDSLATPPKLKNFDGEIGLDVKYGVTQSLTADFTYNTDFAQVENDLQQINLTRFSLFFPEKRDFFLEGQGIFSFGGASTGPYGGDSDQPVLFYSRQIGLAQGQAIPIHAGGRLTGKVGPYNVGLLDIQTAKSLTNNIPSTNFGVVRVKRDIFEKSSIGFLVTKRTPQIGHGSTAFGIDANLGFGLTTINSYYAQTNNNGHSDDNASYYASYDYNEDHYGLAVSHLTVESNFNPEIGFLRRTNFRKNAGTIRYSPRPENLKSVRKFTYAGSAEYITNNTGRLESRNIQLRFGTEFNNGDRFTTNYTREHESINKPFYITPDLTIPVGGYSFSNVSLSYTLGTRYRVRGSFRGRIGSFYKGKRHEINYTDYIYLTRNLLIEPTIAFNWIKLPQGNFRTDLFSTRATYMISPRANFGMLAQYNSRSNTLSSNIRFQWEYIPGSNLYIVYSDNRNTLVLERFSELQNWTFVVKLTRLFRY